jgi:hypothetical protein
MKKSIILISLAFMLVSCIEKKTETPVEAPKEQTPPPLDTPIVLKDTLSDKKGREKKEKVEIKKEEKIKEVKTKEIKEETKVEENIIPKKETINKKSNEKKFYAKGNEIKIISEDLLITLEDGFKIYGKNTLSF